MEKYQIELTHYVFNEETQEWLRIDLPYQISWIHASPIPIEDKRILLEHALDDMCKKLKEEVLRNVNS